MCVWVGEHHSPVRVGSSRNTCHRCSFLPKIYNIAQAMSPQPRQDKSVSATICLTSLVLLSASLGDIDFEASGCSEAPAEQSPAEPVPYAGVMRKQCGGVFGRWHARHFVLKAGRLSWSGEEPPAHASHRITGPCTERRGTAKFLVAPSLASPRRAFSEPRLSCEPQEGAWAPQTMRVSSIAARHADFTGGHVSPRKMSRNAAMDTAGSIRHGALMIGVDIAGPGGHVAEGKASRGHHQRPGDELIFERPLLGPSSAMSFCVRACLSTSVLGAPVAGGLS